MKRVLYLGLDPSHFQEAQQDFDEVIHYPILEVVPLEGAEVCFKKKYTHIVFTSQNGVRLFLKSNQIAKEAEILAVGKVTAHALREFGYEPHHIATEESQEGIIELVKKMPCIQESHFLLPRSVKARAFLTDYLGAHKIAYTEIPLYTVKLKENLPPIDFDKIDGIYFTSPSSVYAFLEKFGRFPKGKELRAIGSVTRKALDEKMPKEP